MLCSKNKVIYMGMIHNYLWCSLRGIKRKGSGGDIDVSVT